MALSLQRQVLVGALAGGLLALGMVVVSMQLAVQRNLELHPLELAPTQLAACAADPVAWGELEMGIMSWRVYDQHGVSASGASPLSVEQRAALPAVGSVLALERRPLRWISRVAQAGPCTYLESTLAPPRGLDRGLQTGMAVAAFLVLFSVSAASYRFTFLPLLSRLARISRGAQAVGAEGYESSDDEVGDDLARIGEVLDRSHDRIRADRAELVRRHQALEEHLASIAHDLRTPLGSLLLAIQEVSAEADSEGARAAARRALSDGSYVSTLVENLHHAARLRHGLEATRGRTDLAELVRRLEVRFGALARASGAEISAAAPEQSVWVQLNPALAERALGNLIGNALQHGAAPRGDEGLVAVVLDVREGRFTLRVLDNGPGLPPERTADLALRTFSDDPARRRGPGLGLAISNEIAARAGWQIDYRPGEEVGLVVTLEGPVASAS